MAREKRRGEEPTALLRHGTGEPEDGHGEGRSTGGGGGLIKTLTWHNLVGVTFFAVCGGDYGIEDSVGSGGVGLSLIALLVLPWVWSLPIALMTAELSSMIPEAGGYVVWAHRAFGPFWATQNAVWNLVRATRQAPPPLNRATAPTLAFERTILISHTLCGSVLVYMTHNYRPSLFQMDVNARVRCWFRSNDRVH